MGGETNETPAPAAPQRCSRCGGSLRLWLLLNSPTSDEEPLRVYRCENCSHFEWADSGEQT